MEPPYRGMSSPSISYDEVLRLRKAEDVIQAPIG